MGSSLLIHVESGVSDMNVPSLLTVAIIIASSSIGSMNCLYSLISEQLVDSMEPTLHALGLKQAFVGVLLIGVTSNVSEIINGTSFGLQNKIALAMEVSSAATIQVLYNLKH